MRKQEKWGGGNNKEQREGQLKKVTEREREISSSAIQRETERVRE